MFVKRGLRSAFFVIRPTCKTSWGMCLCAIIWSDRYKCLYNHWLVNKYVIVILFLVIYFPWDLDHFGE